jgi:hypothetical protein
MLALPPSGRRVSPPPRTLLLGRRSYRLIRQSRVALLDFGFWPRSWSLCRLLPAPAATGILPTLSLRILPQMPGPVPRQVPQSAFTCFFLCVIGLPRVGIGSASCFVPRTRLFAACFSRLQTFLYVQASEFARLPDRSHRCALAQGSRGFYVRAERASLPPHAPNMLAARYR